MPFFAFFFGALLRGDKLDFYKLWWSPKKLHYEIPFLCWIALVLFFNFFLHILNIRSVIEWYFPFVKWNGLSVAAHFELVYTSCATDSTFLNYTNRTQGAQHVEWKKHIWALTNVRKRWKILESPSEQETKKEMTSPGNQASQTDTHNRILNCNYPIFIPIIQERNGKKLQAPNFICVSLERLDLWGPFC